MSPFALNGILLRSLCPGPRESINILALPSTMAKLLSAEEMVTTILSADTLLCGFIMSKVNVKVLPAFIFFLPVSYFAIVSLGILLSTSPAFSLPLVSIYALIVSVIWVASNVSLTE